MTLKVIKVILITAVKTSAIKSKTKVENTVAVNFGTQIL